MIVYLAQESQTATADLGYWTEVLFVSIGVALSVLMPFLMALVKKYWPSEPELTTWDEIWTMMRPYVVLGAFSLVVGLLLAAAADFRERELAVMAGFAWDKTLQLARDIEPRLS